MRIEVVSIRDNIDLVRDLTRMHWEELATHKELMTLKPDVGRYVELEKAGRVLTLALFDGAMIVGYSVTLLDASLHYSDLVMAYNDVLYVHPGYRKGTWGVKLIKRTETEAKARGARLMLFHGKESTNFSTLMPRLGYGVQDIVFGKEI